MISIVRSQEAIVSGTRASFENCVRQREGVSMTLSYKNTWFQRCPFHFSPGLDHILPVQSPENRRRNPTREATKISVDEYHMDVIRLAGRLHPSWPEASLAGSH